MSADAIICQIHTVLAQMLVAHPDLQHELCFALAELRGDLEVALPSEARTNDEQSAVCAIDEVIKLFFGTDEGGWGEQLSVPPLPYSPGGLSLEVSSYQQHAAARGTLDNEQELHLKAYAWGNDSSPEIINTFVSDVGISGRAVFCSNESSRDVAEVLFIVPSVEGVHRPLFVSEGRDTSDELEKIESRLLTLRRECLWLSFDEFSNVRELRVQRQRELFRIAVEWAETFRRRAFLRRMGEVISLASFSNPREASHEPGASVFISGWLDSLINTERRLRTSTMELDERIRAVLDELRKPGCAAVDDISGSVGTRSENLWDRVFIRAMQNLDRFQEWNKRDAVDRYYTRKGRRRPLYDLSWSSDVYDMFTGLPALSYFETRRVRLTYDFFGQSFESLQYEFNGDGLWVSVRDTSDRVLRYSYGTFGSALKSHLLNGPRCECARYTPYLEGYCADGLSSFGRRDRFVPVVDSLTGQIRAYWYDLVGRMLSTYSYDQLGRLMRVTCSPTMFTAASDALAIGAESYSAVEGTRYVYGINNQMILLFKLFRDVSLWDCIARFRGARGSRFHRDALSAQSSEPAGRNFAARLLIEYSEHISHRAHCVVQLPTRAEHYSELRRCIDKKWREQFEMRTHKPIANVRGFRPAAVVDPYQSEGYGRSLDARSLDTFPWDWSRDTGMIWSGIVRSKTRWSSAQQCNEALPIDTAQLQSRTPRATFESLAPPGNDLSSAAPAALPFVPSADVRMHLFKGRYHLNGGDLRLCA